MTLLEVLFDNVVLCVLVELAFVVFSELAVLALSEADALPDTVFFSLDALSDEEVSACLASVF